VAGHLIFAGSAADVAPHHPSHLQPVFAGHLQTGSYVIVNNSGSVDHVRVVRVSWSRDSAGVYAPITERGTLVVDDVIVSCYAELSSHAAAHLSLAPLRYVYHGIELVSRWLSACSSFQSSATDVPVDGVHWYATLLKQLANRVVPAQFWWSSA